ncbi:MAG TPA: alpha-L-fucosidase [Clostridiales bacterium]|nr:alpha-L-fucosidase [Clostridiales bacterium]
MNSEHQVRKTPGDTAWFVRDRLGMFIHFGLYAMPARHEWVKNREKTPEEKYATYFKYFNPDLFDARQWAQDAKNAGMKYVVLTAKHHEGFCNWDSQFTDYKITNTPFGRDLVKEYAEAFREAGLRVGLYYSLIDWHHPDFPIDTLHPRRDDPDALAQNQGRDMRKYAQYMRDQVTELLTNYGEIDILWFDFSYAKYNGTGDKAWMKGKSKDDWEAEKLIATARSIRPGIIIDNRTDLEQDLWTPEQWQPLEWVRHEETGERVVWEACQTFSGSWGYHREEMTWKSPEMLVRMLVNTVSCGGNLLLNVGPTARGEFDARAKSALAALGEWMHLHARSICGCTQSEFTAPQDCRYTQNGKRLYLHIYAWPFKTLFLEGLADQIDYCQLLNDGSEIFWKDKDGKVALELPIRQPNVLVPVIEIFLK